MTERTHLLLVTTDDEDKRLAFHYAVCLYANSFERRQVQGRRAGKTNAGLATINYAVGGERLDHFLEMARKAGVTVQEIHHEGDKETYPYLVGKPGTGWVRPEQGASRG